MNIGSAGIALIKRSEQCELVGYPDEKGIPTIGWGHTGPEVYVGLVWTQEQADQQLQLDCRSAVAAVNDLVTVPLTQNQFDALVDFTYNEGREHLAQSTLLQLLNAGNYAAAAQQFPRWDYAGPVVSLGLLNRRKAEQALFNGNI